MSITSSRKRTQSGMTRASRSQSKRGLSPSLVTKRPRLSEPRLQDSYGSNGCSPQGLVASICPRFSVGLSRLMRSMKTIPGSPFRQALATIRSKMCRARRRAVTSPLRGFTRSYSSSFSTARMNSSVTATEMLKLTSVRMSPLTVMNCSMSGWLTARMPMLAPRRVPPCLIASVAESNTFKNETGPDATPIVERTRSPAGLRRENAKPVPPPD